jgi:nucleoid-associated protein YgaU
MESAAIVAEPDEPKPVVLPGAKNEGAKMAAATVDAPAEPAPVALEAESTEVAETNVQPAESEKAAENTLVAPEDQPKEEYTFVMVEELAAMPLKDITVADTLLYVADGELAEHIVAPDETLTKIARHYFGDKKLWPYIVKYNGMRDPNGLCSGMTISIPRLKPVR